MVSPIGTCPLGKLCCDGCQHLTTAGCAWDSDWASYPTANYSKPASFESREMEFEARRKQLMDLPKEDLVKMIMGSKEEYIFQIMK